MATLATYLSDTVSLDFFRFPVNVIVLALWLIVILVLYHNRERNAMARFMLSRRATWLTLVAMVGISITLGLQSKPSPTSWPIMAAMFFILSHLCFIVLRGWRNREGIRWRFCLIHLGLLLAMGADFWGAPDREELRATIYRIPSNEVYTKQGVLQFLPYTITLDTLFVEYSEKGVPSHYEAMTHIDGKDISLRVNHPYNRTPSEKIYLTGFNKTPTGHTDATIKIVREPWQWVTATGIIMLIAGAVLLFIQGPLKTGN